MDLMTDPTPELADRLATLAHRHRSPGVRLAEQRATRPCAVCGEAGALMPRGVRCPAHRPDPVVPVPVVPALGRVVPMYGEATTDPLGRGGDGWRTSRQTRLPTRTRDA